MPMMFNSLLDDAELSLSDVRLLRHKDNRSDRGRSTYDLWRDNRPHFEFYQSIQAIENEPRLNAPVWASFLGTPADETMFFGIYRVKGKKVLDEDVPKVHTGEDVFWGRWQCYLKTGHGGNVKLKSREPSDYQVSILEVAGSAAELSQILEMETRWKAKLQTKEMGLNGN